MSDVIPPGGTHPLIVRHAMQPKSHHDVSSHSSDQEAASVDSNEHHVAHHLSAVSQNSHAPASSTTHPRPVPATTHRGPHSHPTHLHHSHSLPHSLPHSHPHPSHHPLNHIQLPAPPYHRAGSIQISSQTSLERPPVPQYIVYVTIDNVPANFDIMSFIFLANYGQVIEGKAETQDFQILHDGIPYLYRTYTGVYSFTLIVDKDRDITNLMALNMATVSIKGHYLQVLSKDHHSHTLT